MTRAHFSGDSPGLAVWHACHPLESHGLLSRRSTLQIIKSRDVMQLVAKSMHRKLRTRVPLPVSSITSTPKTPLLSSSQSTTYRQAIPIGCNPHWLQPQLHSPSSFTRLLVLLHITLKWGYHPCLISALRILTTTLPTTTTGLLNPSCSPYAKLLSVCWLQESTGAGYVDATGVELMAIEP